MARPTPDGQEYENGNWLRSLFVLRPFEPLRKFHAGVFSERRLA